LDKIRQGHETCSLTDVHGYNKRVYDYPLVYENIHKFDDTCVHLYRIRW